MSTEMFRLLVNHYPVLLGALVTAVILPSACFSLLCLCGARWLWKRGDNEPA